MGLGAKDQRKSWVPTSPITDELTTTASKTFHGSATYSSKLLCAERRRTSSTMKAYVK